MIHKLDGVDNGEKQQQITTTTSLGRLDTLNDNIVDVI